MPRLTRYVLAELAKVFAITLFVMTLLMLLGGVVQEAISQSLGIAQIVKLLPYVLPDALRFAVPATALFTAASVYGRLSAFNEVVAVKAAGISPMRLLSPALVATFLLSLATVWLNDVAVSWGRSGVQGVVIDAIEEIVYGVLRTQRSYSTRQLSINVKAVESRKLIQPTLTYQSSSERPPTTIRAEYAELHGDSTNNTLSIVFYNGTIDIGDEFHAEFPNDAWRFDVPLADAAAGKIDSMASPSFRPLRAIPDDIVQQELRIARMEQQLVVKAAYALTTGELAPLSAATWSAEQRKVAEQRSRLYRLRTEPHRRWANGFSCLCFVLVGAPMAIRRRNGHVLTTFAFCFLPILLLYYPLLMYGVDRAKAGALPPQSVWLGNVLLFVWGFWLLQRVRRY